MADSSGYNFKLYRYDPSLPAAIIAVVVFAILTSVHLWKVIKLHTRYFIPFTIGGVCKCCMEQPTIASIQWSH